MSWDTMATWPRGMQGGNSAAAKCCTGWVCEGRPAAEARPHLSRCLGLLLQQLLHQGIALPLRTLGAHLPLQHLPLHPLQQLHHPILHLLPPNHQPNPQRSGHQALPVSVFPARKVDHAWPVSVLSLRKVQSQGAIMPSCTRA